MTKTLQIIAFIIINFLTTTICWSQSILGKWKTVDDETNEAKSIVEITERSGKIYGRVVRLFRNPNEDPDPLCNECPTDDSRYNKKVVGMEVIKDMVADDNEFSGGSILDPKIGKIYRCRLWLEGEYLKVRGYWGPFYRTQTWHKSN